MKLDALKVIGITLIIVTIVFFFLMFLGKIPPLTFFIGMGVLAFLAYGVIPRLRR